MEISTLEIVVSIVAAILLPWIGWATHAINHIARETHDMHGWQKPTDDGVQEWKNPQIRKAIEKLTSEVRGMREDLKEAFRKVNK